VPRVARSDSGGEAVHSGPDDAPTLVELQTDDEFGADQSAWRDVSGATDEALGRGGWPARDALGIQLRAGLCFRQTGQHTSAGPRLEVSGERRDSLIALVGAEAHAGDRGDRQGDPHQGDPCAHTAPSVARIPLSLCRPLEDKSLPRPRSDDPPTGDTTRRTRGGSQIARVRLSVVC
jgi:hypothetical protein